MPASPRKPATGTAVWEDDCPETGNPCLRITVVRASGEVVSHLYEVEDAAPEPNYPRGYNLYRLDDHFHLITYRVRIDAAGVWWCDCPDTNMSPTRTNFCKHTRGLKAALAKRPF